MNKNKYAFEDNIPYGKNEIINRSLETKIKEDRVIKIITNEVTDFVLKLFKNIDHKK